MDIISSTALTPLDYWFERNLLYSLQRQFLANYYRQSMQFNTKFLLVFIHSYVTKRIEFLFKHQVCVKFCAANSVSHCCVNI